MMRFFLAFLILLATTVNAENVEVIVPGSLSTQLTDYSIKELVLSGTINTADCSFISNELESIENLDMKSVKMIDALPNNFLANSNSIERIIFPDTLLGAGVSCLYRCSNLKSVSVGSYTSDDFFNNIGDYSYNIKEFVVDTKNQKICSVDGAVYSKDTTELLRLCSGYSGGYIMPNKVALVNAKAFYFCDSISRIVISDSLKSFVDGSILWSCQSLTEFKCNAVNPNFAVEDGVLFNNNRSELIAFPPARGGEYSVPSSVKRIKKNAFYSCSKLKSIYTGDSTSYIGRRAFSGTNNLINVKFGNLIENASGTNIWSNKIKTITVGESFNYFDKMGYEEDYYNNITLYLYCSEVPKEYTRSGFDDFYNAFSHGYGMKFYVPDSMVDKYKVAPYWSRRNITGLKYVEIECSEPGNLAIALIANNHKPLASITHLKVTGTINDIDIYHLNNTLTSLVELDLSDARIEGDKLYDSSFAHKVYLEKIILPRTLNVIGESAFEGCKRLKSISPLPQNLQAIENSAFKQCSFLFEDLYIPNETRLIGAYAFASCGLSGCVVLPDSIEIINDYAFSNCVSITDLHLPESLKSIGDYAFYNCGEMKGTLNLPESLHSIGEFAFSGCKGLTGDLILPNSLTKLGQSAFSACSGFAGQLIIGQSLKTIEKRVFMDCSSLSGDLLIPDSIVSIGERSFYNCRGFDSILKLPKCLRTIGVLSFAQCYGLKGDLIFAESLTRIGKSAFHQCRSLSGSLHLPNSLLYIENNAFQDCNSLNGRLILPSNLKELGIQAFANCFGFTGELVIPNTIAKINQSVFEGCKSLDSLYISNSTKEISAQAFKSCSNIKNITIEADKPIVIYANTFQGVDKEACWLDVPTGSSMKYKKANYWQDFILYTEYRLPENYEIQSELIAETCLSKTITFSIDTSEDLLFDSIRWDFGDGALIMKTDSKSVTYTFSGSGFYDVNLYVWNRGEKKGVNFPNEVHIKDTLVADFNYQTTKDNNFAPLALEFVRDESLEVYDSVTYKWTIFDFDKTVELYGDTVFYTFNESGAYQVRLEVVDRLGCTSFKEDIIQVRDSAQEGEIPYIVGDCDSDCTQGINYTIKNDTLIVYGTVTKNCCSENTVVVKDFGDTIKIQSFETFPLGVGCYCVCDYCFEIMLPNFSREECVLTFDDTEIYIDNKPQSLVETSERDIWLQPNPTTGMVKVKVLRSYNDINAEFYSLQGELLSQYNSVAEAIEVPIEQGVCLLKLTIDGKLVVKRVVKM